MDRCGRSNRSVCKHNGQHPNTPKLDLGSGLVRGQHGAPCALCLAVLSHHPSPPARLPSCLSLVVPWPHYYWSSYWAYAAAALSLLLSSLSTHRSCVNSRPAQSIPPISVPRPSAVILPAVSFHVAIAIGQRQCLPLSSTPNLRCSSIEASGGVGACGLDLGI